MALLEIIRPKDLPAAAAGPADTDVFVVDQLAAGVKKMEFSAIRGLIQAGGSAIGLLTGASEPEGLITGNPGFLFFRISGTTRQLWVKETGVGNTGWSLWIEAQA